MNNVKHSQAFLRKRKMLLVLPCMVIPFLTMAFWALGGGKGVNAAPIADRSKGLNLHLPNANLHDEKGMNKLTFYERAEKDSIKMADWNRNDPYYEDTDSSAQEINELEQIVGHSASKYNQLNTSPSHSGSNNDMIEQQLLKKISQLEKQINISQNEDQTIESELTYPVQEKDNSEFSSEIDRLESMLQLMNEKQAVDPEMTQLEGTLDKILDVQHPERIKDRLKEKSEQKKQFVFPVSRSNSDFSISLIGQKKNLDTLPKIQMPAGFYGVEDQTDEATQYDNSIEAVIHQNQTLVNGSVIKLRLVNDIYINGVLIPKDNFVFGIAALNGERLEIEINSIRYQQSLFTVKLEVYDLDGLAGIYIPGAITRDVAKQSANNSLQMMELATLDPSIQAQAATAGVNTIKNLLSKKVKLVKVIVKAGYKVLLRDSKQKQ